MVLEKRLGQKVRPAGMPGTGHKTHVGCHSAVGRLALHRTPRVVGIPSPFLHSPSRGIDVPAQPTLVRLIFVFEGIDVI